eukprot:188936_1
MSPLLFSIIALISGCISECVPATPSSFSFTSENHILKLNGNEFFLKGAAWFGSETTSYVVDGLWQVTYSSLLDFLVSNNYNAIRLPFCVDMINNNPMPNNTINYNINPELKGMSALQVYDFIIQQAGNRGLLIMLDMHRLNCMSQNPLWYDNQHPTSLVNSTWLKLINRYTKQWNVFAVDIFNEPSGATWGDNNPKTDWSIWCSQMGNTIHNIGNTKYLIFCEGIANGCNPGCFWGESLVYVGQHPIQLQQQNKLVYSPHVYGPDVYNQTYFQTNDFPNNMPGIWNGHFGYIGNLTGNDKSNAVVTGEWGGYYTDDDAIWYDAFVNYMVSINFRNNFFWCLNPNSGGTGGLLENDWKTPVTAKLNKGKEMQSTPTKFTYFQNNNTVCY